MCNGHSDNSRLASKFPVPVARPGCFFHQANITFVSTASAITLLTISVDRYEAVVTPLKKKVIQHNMKKDITGHLAYVHHWFLFAIYWHQHKDIIRRRHPSHRNRRSNHRWTRHSLETRLAAPRTPLQTRQAMVSVSQRQHVIVL